MKTLDESIIDAARKHVDCPRTYLPAGKRVFCKPDTPEEMTKAGLHIPDSARKPPLVGTVIAVGVELQGVLGAPVVGDRVMWGGMNQVAIPKRPTDGDVVALVFPNEVLCVFSDTRPETDEEVEARLSAAATEAAAGDELAAARAGKLGAA